MLLLNCPLTSSYPHKRKLTSRIYSTSKVNQPLSPRTRERVIRRNYRINRVIRISCLSPSNSLLQWLKSRGQSAGEKLMSFRTQLDGLYSQVVYLDIHKSRIRGDITRWVLLMQRLLSIPTGGSTEIKMCRGSRVESRWTQIMLIRLSLMLNKILVEGSPPKAMYSKTQHVVTRHYASGRTPMEHFTSTKDVKWP